MKRFTQRKGLIAGVLTATMSVYLASCGTILHPERRGQPPGRLDPGIVILDAVGLLLFFIPGIIAFAVDFSNGTIYLPPEQSAAPPVEGVNAYRTVRINPTELTPQRLESVLQDKTGQTVRLDEGSYRAAPLERIEQFTPSAVADLEANPTPARVLFRGASR